MRKTMFIAAFLLGCIGLSAQEYHINLHNDGSVIYDNAVSDIREIYFRGSQPANMHIYEHTGTTVLPLAAFDSITFVQQEGINDTVYITYNDSNVDVINPFADNGITFTTDNADVTVHSSKAGIKYLVSGTSSDGSLSITSGHSYGMILKNLNLTSNTTAAISLEGGTVLMKLIGNSSIADSPNSPINGALYNTSPLVVNGDGTLEVTGNAKHGIAVEGGMLRVDSGTIRILETDSDGIHGSDKLEWNGGTLDIVSAGSDGLDFSQTVTISGGNLTINTTTDTQRSIKATNTFRMTGGTLNLNITGNDCKGIKGDADVILNGGTLELQVAGEGSNGISSDTDVTVNGANVTIVSSSLDGNCIKSDGTFRLSSGSIDLSHSGDISKGIKAVGDITIYGGILDINSSGNTVVTNNDPAYCTAIKGDANVIIIGGNITITLPTSNHGGKGISCAGNMTITGNNTINIETHGDGATYPASSPTDTYSSSCLRAEGNMEILSGNITLNSTGKGGKGIKVGTQTGNTYTGTYTQGNTDGTGPTLTITTTGAQVGSGGGGGWPPGPGGGNSVKASAKAIKVGGVATLYGGTTTINTSTSGAEGLESKTAINIEGGQHYFHCYDDCISSAGNITFEGGVTVCFSNGNDAVDSNAGHAGAITIGNGVAFAYSTKGSPEEGFDCDNNNYIRITGTGIGISAGGSQGGGGWPGGGGGGGTITNPAQGYKFYTNSYNFQTGRYYTLSNTSGSGGTNMVTFSFEANCNSTLALITATGMVSGNTYYVNYGTQAPTNPTTAFHGIYLGGTSSASSQAFSFTAQ